MSTGFFAGGSSSFLLPPWTDSGTRLFGREPNLTPVESGLIGLPPQVKPTASFQQRQTARPVCKQQAARPGQIRALSTGSVPNIFYQGSLQTPGLRHSTYPGRQRFHYQLYLRCLYEALAEVSPCSATRQDLSALALQKKLQAAQRPEARAIALLQPERTVSHEHQDRLQRHQKLLVETDVADDVTAPRARSTSVISSSNSYDVRRHANGPYVLGP